tara:strand:+ start:923 stop:1447 length:525 start_codon:yes stop_codon:yes gene_type:complete
MKSILSWVQKLKTIGGFIMSAFLVNEKHIAELVKGYFKHELYNSITWINPSTGEEIDIAKRKFESEPLAVAFFLAWANVESLKARYGEKSVMTDFSVSDYCASVVQATRNNNNADLSLAELIKMCDCLNYQSCEVEGYNNSDQYHILKRIKDSFVYKLVDQSLNENGVRWEYVA